MEMGIGYNISHGKQELAEDLLEFLYGNWKRGREVGAKEVKRAFGLEYHDLRGAEGKLEENGWIFRRERGECYRLTNAGKICGEECYSRHRDLSHFLQMTCEVGEAVAEENACRMEHLVSREVMAGVRNFLRTGNTCEFEFTDSDLRRLYEEGIYRFCMSMYLPGVRYPRILARENGELEEEVLAEISEGGSVVYFQPKGEGKWLWYRDGSQWKRSERTGKGYQVPSDVFSYTVDFDTPVREGYGMVAYIPGEDAPQEHQYREMNLHIW